MVFDDKLDLDEETEQCNGGIMIPLENREFETDEGLWRTEYIGSPKAPNDTDRIAYYLRFKWVDQRDRENRVTPERRLRLTAYSSQTAANDCEKRLIDAISSWLNSDIESEAVFDYESRSLRPSRT